MDTQISVTVPMSETTYLSDVRDMLAKGSIHRLAHRKSEERGRTPVGDPRIDFPREVGGVETSESALLVRFTFDTAQSLARHESEGA